MSSLVLTFENNDQRAHTYWIEPWAYDFTLLPGEKFELRLAFAGEPLVEISHNETDTQIYLNEEKWSIFQGASELELGHNRQFSLGAAKDTV